MTSAFGTPEVCWRIAGGSRAKRAHHRIPRAMNPRAGGAPAQSSMPDEHACQHPSGVQVLACRVPVVRSLSLANHRLFTSTPPVCVETASLLGAKRARTLGAKPHG